MTEEKKYYQDDKPLENKPSPEGTGSRPADRSSKGDDGDRLKKLLIAGIIVILLVLSALVLVFLKKTGRLGGSSRQAGDINITESYYGGDSVNQNNNSSGSSSDNLSSAQGGEPEDTGDSTGIVRMPDPVEISTRLKLPVPKQSGIMSEENIPAGAVRVVGTENGFEPREFTVKSGEETILALTARAERPVVMTFYDSNLAAISIGCGPGETRWVTFTAPLTKGEYAFRNDTIGLNNQTGKMIVK
jgi:hypothetical protein